MHIGYARVSTGEQNLDLQTDALKSEGCERVFTDRLSGATAGRPGLQQAMDYAREGDVLVVWRLDRFGRSLKDLIAKVETLKERASSSRASRRTSTPPPVPDGCRFISWGPSRSLSGTSIARPIRRGSSETASPRARPRCARAAYLRALRHLQGPLYRCVGPNGEQRYEGE